MAGQYDEDRRHDAIARALVGLVAPADHESVVDVACGTGAVALAVAAVRGRTAAVTVLPNMIMTVAGKPLAGGPAAGVDNV